MRSVSNNRSSSYPERLELIITGYTFFSSKYTYLSVSGSGFRSNTGSSFGCERIPKGSTGRLFFRIGVCLKNMCSSSSLYCICISFSWSSINCCKVSLGGIAMEAISSIILSLLDRTGPRGCLENLEKLNSYGSPLNSTETFPFLKSIIAPQVLTKGLPKIIGQKLSCTEPSTRKSVGYFTFPQSTSTYPIVIVISYFDRYNWRT